MQLRPGMLVKSKAGRDKDHVYVLKSENHYRLTPVELGAASAGLRPVIKGLSEGAQIVVEGSFHLNNERKRAELE